MKLVKNPNEYSCMLASFAMLLNEPMDVLVEELGHDGSEIWWPELFGCMQYRGFHVQEFLDLCYKRGKIIFPVESVLTLGFPPIQEAKSIKMDNEKRFKMYTRSFKGILYGLVPSTRIFHACAWDRKKVYDPRGKVTDLASVDLAILAFYALHNL